MFYGKITPLPLSKKAITFMKSYPGLALLLGFVCLIWAILYKLVWVNIEAPCESMVAMGDIFYSIVLSVIASVIFYYVTTFIPNYHKKATADKLILRWLQQLDNMGEQILVDISNCNYDEVLQLNFENFDKKCGKKLTGQPVLGNLYIFGPKYKNWFEYFDDKFEEEEYYIQNCLQYQTYIHIEVMALLEDITIHSNLKTALQQYRYDIATGNISRLLGKTKVDFDDMHNISNLVWSHCHDLKKLIETYQSNSEY